MKLKYILNKIMKVNHKEFNTKVSILSNKINKPKISIKIDMLKCLIKYGSGYTNYIDYEFYLLNKKEKSTYLTDAHEIYIKNTYNKKKTINNQEIYSVFKNYLHRNYIDLKSATYKDFKDFILNKNIIIAKSNESFEIIDIDKTKLKNEYNILKLYNNIMKKEEYIIEDYLMSINNKSIYSDNITLIYFLNNGEVKILNEILKTNNKITLLKKGKIILPLIDENKHTSHDNIIGIKVPDYDKIKEFVKEIALKIPDITYGSVTVSKTQYGISLVNLSSNPKPFQPTRTLGIKTGLLNDYKKYIEIRW